MADPLNAAPSAADSDSQMQAMSDVSHPCEEGAAAADAIRYHQMFGLLQLPVLLLKENRIQYANPAAEALLGARQGQQLAGQQLTELLVPASPLSGMAGSAGQAPVCSGIRRFDGSTIEVELNIVPYPVECGGDALVLIRQQALQQAAASNQSFRALLDHCPDAIARIDSQLRYLYANPAMEAITRIAAHELPGKRITEIGMPDDFVTAWENTVRHAFAANAEQHLDFALTENGHVRHYAARIIPEAGSSGGIGSALAIIHDITPTRKIEHEHAQLLSRERAARIKAETAARARNEFLAIVSHELRAPLNGIQSWAHILETYAKDSLSAPLAQRALNGIRTGVAQQVRLIEDLLDVTRMMSGKLRLVKQPFALLPVIQAAVESVRGAAAAKRISISCNYQITHEQVDGDSDRVQQILWNLLSNAVKFTPNEGNVWLTARRSGPQVTITIRDNGVGISPDFLPHLFDRFSQEDTSSTRPHNGLGLGLFLARHLIELHNGTVHAESEGEGKGTTFTISLPLRSAGEKYASSDQNADAGDGIDPLPSLEGLRILLIDDQEETRESLSMVLLSAGANVFSAASSKEVLEWLPTVGLDELPDILICDIAMPGEDGYSVLRKLRTWKTNKGFAPLHQLPALALTAFAQREDRIRALTAGFQMHMTKPVAPEELIVVVAMMASRV